jgi:hypothetical protein
MSTLEIKCSICGENVVWISDIGTSNDLFRDHLKTHKEHDVETLYPATFKNMKMMGYFEAPMVRRVIRTS